MTRRVATAVLLSLAAPDVAGYVNQAPISSIYAADRTVIWPAG